MKALRKNSLTNEQLKRLKSMRMALPLVADLSHAIITIYLKADKKFFKVYASNGPKTRFIDKVPLQNGRKLFIVEEPLVNRVLKTGLVIAGKREWEFGTFLYTKIYPVLDSLGNCYAAVGFETNQGSEIENYDVFIEQAFLLLKHTSSQLFASENYQRLSASDGMMVVNADKKIIAANSNAQHIFAVLGCTELIGMRTSSVEINWPLVGMVLKAGIAESKEYSMHGLNIAMRVIPIVDGSEVKTAVVVFSDITELKKRDEQILVKSFVIKEIHHRVKNNLQTIASLLRLHARRAESDEVKEALKDSINRVNSIAIVHDYLSKDDDVFDIKQAVKGIYDELLRSMVSPELKLETSFSMEEINISSKKANDIALVVNELLQNALEHGFENAKEGKLDVSFKEFANEYVLEIKDNGQGLPKDFDLRKTKSLGLKIINTMVVADLKGTFELISLEKGTLAKVKIPKEGVRNG